MKVVDADKFLSYLIYSKHIDGLTCGEVKEAVEMCKVDVIDNLSVEIEHVKDNPLFGMVSNDTMLEVILEIIDKYRTKSEVQE